LAIAGRDNTAALVHHGHWSMSYYVTDAARADQQATE
jgi:hypothetical protein